MYRCESWTIRKAECQRIDAFELWCWRRLLRVPWRARRSNQSILKEISPEYSLEGLMLKLKLPILGPPDAKNWLIWKDPDAGKSWKREEKGTQDEMVGWHHSMPCPTPWTWIWASSRSWGWTGKLGVLQSMGSQRVGHDWVTELNWIFNKCLPYARQLLQALPTFAHLSLSTITEVRIIINPNLQMKKKKKPWKPHICLMSHN